MSPLDEPPLNTLPFQQAMRRRGASLGQTIQELDTPDKFTFISAVPEIPLSPPAACFVEVVVKIS
jgi:hypothetical protein